MACGTYVKYAVVLRIDLRSKTCFVQNIQLVVQNMQKMFENIRKMLNIRAGQQIVF